MSLVKIGTLLLVSAVFACVLFVVVVLATPTPEPDAPLNFWQVLGTLLLIYWLGAAVAGAILLLVNLFSSGGRIFSNIWPPSRWAVEYHPADADRATGNRSGRRPADRSETRDNATRASTRPRIRPRLHREILLGQAQFEPVCSVAVAALRTAAGRDSATRVRVRCQVRRWASFEHFS